MSAARSITVGMCAAGLSCLFTGGFAQSQQVRDHTKPTQHADQDTNRQRDNQQRQDNRGQQDNQGQKNTTYFRGPGEVGANDRGAIASVDNYLANCLLMKNQGEIELNQFAEGRAKHEDVKQFAQQMVAQHRELGEKLERVVQSGRDANRDAALTQLLDIDRQIGEKCGQMTRAKLEEAPEDQFDKCFVGSQIGAHMQMLAALDVISEQSSGELRQVTQDAKATVKQHLEHAEKLMKDLDSADNRQARN